MSRECRDKIRLQEEEEEERDSTASEKNETFVSFQPLLNPY